MGQFDDPFFWQKKKMRQRGAGMILISKKFWIAILIIGVLLQIANLILHFIHRLK